MLDSEKLQIAKDVYFTVFPVATGVITYWFASRKSDTDSGASTENGANKVTPGTRASE